MALGLSVRPKSPSAIARAPTSAIATIAWIMENVDNATLLKEM
jgi:hypothetical protein